MNREASELLERALKLPPEARAALAGSLIDSLDETMDEGVEQAWEIEVARRVRELREGQVDLIPWSEARRRIAGQ
jgi:putative addiction module component (TIGR02574 family)